MKFLKIAFIFTLDVVIFAQLPASWNPSPSFYFSHPLHRPLPPQITGQMDSSYASYPENAMISWNDVPYLRELKYTSQRLDEAMLDIQTVKNDLDVLVATSQNLAKTMVTIWILTTTKLEESLKRTAESLERLTETNNVVAKIKRDLSESAKDSAVMKATLGNLTAELKASTSAKSIGRIPSSCEDLQLIGHMKSGLFSIMGNKSIETAYCDFTKLPKQEDFQNLIGSSDVKSVPTFFSVQKNTSYSRIGVPIPFEISKVNTGKAMEIASGIFTTPRSGTYYFSFIGSVEFPPSPEFSYLEMGLYLNGNRQGTGYASNTRDTDYKFSQITLQMMFTLQEGDKVWLQIQALSDAVSLRDVNDEYHTHFTGLFLQEDFS